MHLFFAIFFFLLLSNDVYSKNLDTQKKQKTTLISVNGKIISTTEINQRMIFISKLSNINFSKNYQKSWLQTITDRLIEEELIRQKAIQYKIVIDQSQIENYKNGFVNSIFKNQANFQKFLKSNNLDINNFHKQIEAEIIWSKIADDFIKPSITVSTIEIKEWLEKDKINKNNQKYLFNDYLIASPQVNQDFANKLYLEIIQKKGFINILNNFINSKNSSNSVNWLWSDEINPKILAKISNLNNNEFSEPVLLDDGYHIFELIDKRNDLNLSSQEFEFIKNQIFLKKFEVVKKLYLQDLKIRSYIDQI
jgi:parvulin-like peptidyl-prolyl isomerase